MEQAPYDQLYIYEIAGDARAWSRDLGPGFLGLWLEGDSSFLFFSSPSDHKVARLISLAGSLKLLDRHFLTYDQWQGGADLEPIQIDGLMVVPSWNPPPNPEPGVKILRLNPGLVFGNGLHPTTRHSLELLAMEAARGPLGKVVDLGCGTGILALAAATLGAEPVLAVDLNPLCISTTMQNAHMNGIDIEVREGPALEFASAPARLVLANLHWEVQEELWSDQSTLTDLPDLILSGVTRSQVGRLEDLVVSRGYHVAQRREAESTWYTLLCRASSALR